MSTEIAPTVCQQKIHSAKNEIKRNKTQATKTDPVNQGRKWIMKAMLFLRLHLFA